MDTPASPPVETVAIDRLFCSPTNPRLNDQAVPHVAASIRRFGWQQPIVARRSGEVVAGTTRLKAAQSLGMTEVPVWWFEGSDLDAVAFNIADNRTHSFSEFDEPVLAALLQQLKAEDSLDGVGYSEDDIDALVQQLRDQEEVDKQLDDEGAEEPPVVAIAKTGDLWVLGEHKLLCGDSTNLKDVLRVMGNDKAALVATDPPYLVDYTGERPNDSGKDWTATYREIDIKDADGFFRAVFVNVLEVLAHKGAIYCWHAHKRCGDIQRIWRDLGILDHQQIIWVKPTPVFGRVYWHFRHEPCVMGWRQGDKPEHDGVHEHDSVVGVRLGWESTLRRVIAPFFETNGAVRAPHQEAHERRRHRVRAVLGQRLADHRRRTHWPPLPRHRDQRALRRRGDSALAEGDGSARDTGRRRQVVRRCRDRARPEHHRVVIGG
ncbi:MAG: ParB N-terminal domain-containing protein [Planctomycetota bacterium]